jgi:hypothetical protein
MATQRKMTLIEAGVEAWQRGQPYHRSRRQKPRYHIYKICPAGLKIELRHLRAGDGQRELCGVCRELAR